MNGLIVPWWRTPLRWWPTHVQWAWKRLLRRAQLRAVLVASTLIRSRLGIAFGALMRRLSYCTTGAKVTAATKLRRNRRYGKAR